MAAEVVAFYKENMTHFIELPVTNDDETKPTLVNIHNIGRLYPDPQNTRRCLVELNYHSINDAPVLLEVELPYDKAKALLA